jgi:hypothetical protein
MKKRVLNTLLTLMFIAMLLPAIQQFSNFPRIKSLKGAITIPKKPKLSLQGYFDASLQDSMDTYVENTIGFRPILVRLHNQIQYSLFDTVNAQGVIFGENGYLFELNYIKAFYGLNFVGFDKINTDIIETRFVNDWLLRQEKHLIVVLAPGKGTFFKDQIPDSYKPDSIHITNNKVYIDSLSKYQIPIIDGNSYFEKIKDTSQFALFPKSGIHWSYYGMGLIFDSLLQKMEIDGGKKFIDFGMKNIEVSKKLRSPDQDLWEGMNVFAQPSDYAMPYPKFYFENPVKENMPKVIVVADSYYWQWFGSGYATRSFHSHDFWYYNTQIYPGNGGEAIQRHNVDIISRVMETDFVILLQTDANMDRYSFGFIHDLYLAIQKLDAMSTEDLLAIEKIIAGIKASPDYMKTIEKKAAQRHISVEEMLRGDAMWVFQNKKKSIPDKNKK